MYVKREVLPAVRRIGQRGAQGEQRDRRRKGVFGIACEGAKGLVKRPECDEASWGTRRRSDAITFADNVQGTLSGRDSRRHDSTMHSKSKWTNP